MKTETVAMLLLSCLVLSFAAPSVAGPLTPPPGPIASTPGPEPRRAVNLVNTPGDSFFLYRITSPGSYYLESNLTTVPGRFWVVSIEAPGVTLDLNGFTIDGLGGSGGIFVDQQGALIRNGTIRNVVFAGVSASLYPTGAPGMIVEHLRVQDALGPGSIPGTYGGGGTVGIAVGREAIVRNCTVRNAAIGIGAGYMANISHCNVESCRQIGFAVGDGSQVSYCNAVGTAGGPVDGIGFLLSVGSTASNCQARGNSGSGFFDETGECVFDRCSSTSNGAAGFVLKSRSRLDTCQAASNAGPAVRVANATGWEISRCTISSSASDGVVIESSSGEARISDCSIRSRAVFTQGRGVAIGVGCNDIVIRGCEFSRWVRAIELDGGYCRVTGNAFNFNSGDVLNSSAAAPALTNLIGPFEIPSTILTATNPFANTSQ